MNTDSSELLTVIIPFLNEGEEVRNTLDSIRKHGGGKVAVILINDASDDGYPYESYATEFEAGYIFNQERQGVARSRDMGIERCATPYFLLLDAHMRFYQEDWIPILTGELKKDERVLLCCNSRILRKNEQGEMYDDPKGSRTFGARVHLERDPDILSAKWVDQEQYPEEEIEDITCVLGAAYAASKKYWQYLKGLNGLIYYGSDEGYISMKVWLEGGRCRLLKNLYVGHYYRRKAPYRIETSFVLYNKLLITYLLLPWYVQGRAYSALQQKYSSALFLTEFRHLMEKQEEWDALKEYYSRIFTRDFNEIVEANRRRVKVLPEKKTLLKEVYYKVLLNCNSMEDLGIAEGRMGAILFLAAYAHYRKEEMGDELAGILMDQLYEKLSVAMPLNWTDGLYGIAYAITWLIANGFMEGNVSEVLSDIDARIMERDPLRMTDYSWEYGLAGLLFYVLFRLKYEHENKQDQRLPFDSDYLEALEKVSRRVLADPECVSSWEMALFYLEYRAGREVHWEMFPDVFRVVNFGNLDFEEAVDRAKYGLKKGWAGFGMRLLEREIFHNRSDAGSHSGNG